jgi:molybdenum cofactor cytidylyltransferase
MKVPKLSLELAPGSRLGSIALNEMIGCDRLDSITVVVREKDELNWVPRESEHAGTKNAKLRIVSCPRAADGMSYSLREGLRDALSQKPDAILIVLADQPFISSDLLDRLVAAYVSEPDLDFVACAGEAIGKPPALFAYSMFLGLSRLEGDMGARKLLASPDYRGKLVQVASDLVFADIDTPFDLKEARCHWIDSRTKGGDGDGERDETNGVGGNAPNLQTIR